MTFPSMVCLMSLESNMRAVRYTTSLRGAHSQVKVELKELIRYCHCCCLQVEMFITCQLVHLLLP